MAARKEKKDRSRSPGPRASSSSAADLSNANGENVPLSTPPPYNSLDPSSTQHGLVETTNEQQARELIERGQAAPVENMLERREEKSGADPDEAYWELDEAAGTLQESASTVLDEQSEGKEEKPDVHKLVQQFLAAHPAPSIPAPKAPLPCPVIVPQRRPHTKARGFVRAYAPVLEDAGIDQDTFMEFLKLFHKAQQVRKFGDTIPAGRANQNSLHPGLTRLHRRLCGWSPDRLRSILNSSYCCNKHPSDCWDSNRAPASPQVR